MQLGIRPTGNTVRKWKSLTSNSGSTGTSGNECEPERLIGLPRRVESYPKRSRGGPTLDLGQLRISRGCGNWPESSPELDPTARGANRCGPIKRRTCCQLGTT